jgi:hypothetical protein
MDGQTPARTVLSLQINGDLLDELQRIATEARFPSLDSLIEKWLMEKATEWHVRRVGSQPQTETFEELVQEKDRLLEWMANYVSAVQRSELEMRQALDHIERLRALIPHKPSAS